MKFNYYYYFDPVVFNGDFDLQILPFKNLLFCNCDYYNFGKEVSLIDLLLPNYYKFVGFF